MEEKRVKPCPFCGGGAVFFRNGTRETIKCIVCGAEVSRECWAIAGAGAVDAWNRRTAGDADPKTAAVSTKELCATIRAAVKEFEHGARWIRTDTGTTCEACGGAALLDDDGQTVLSAFCPHCGEKMWRSKRWTKSEG